MPDNQLEFHSAYGKRRILIVEDLALMDQSGHASDE